VYCPTQENIEIQCQTNSNDFTVIQTLGTIKASQVVVLNENMLLLRNENLCKQHDPHLQNEFDFVEKHIH